MGDGSLFLHCKATLLISVKIITQSILCSTIQQSVKYDSQQFVSCNLSTLGTAIHQIAIITYFTNFYETFYAIRCVFQYELRKSYQHNWDTNFKV